MASKSPSLWKRTRSSGRTVRAAAMMAAKRGLKNSRQQAGLIQKQVSCLMEDVHRLSDRVLKLQQHFGQANEDIDNILISTDKVVSRGRKIETLEFEENAPAQVEHHNGASPSPLASPPREEAVERRRNGGFRQPDLLAKDS